MMTNPYVQLLISSELAFKKLFQSTEQRLKENGTLIVKDQGQFTMQVGNELSFDEVVPVSESELKWRDKVNKLKNEM